MRQLQPRFQQILAGNRNIGDMAVICFRRNDRRHPRLYGIQLGGSGDVTATNHVWKREDIASFVPSPVAYQGRVYLVRDRGEVECVDPATGKAIWNDAYPKEPSQLLSITTDRGGKSPRSTQGRCCVRGQSE